MALREIKGQEQAIGLLKKSVASGRISHAYLFYGPEGIGKELSAKNFAKLLNCRTPEKGDACDFCEDCVGIEKKRHPDLIWLRPQGPARVIPIEKIRDFQKAVSLKPYTGRWKIGIFPEAHTLKRDAASALLKTLEEPPKHTILILVTARPEILLPTIVSRCQAIRFSPMSREKLKGVLKKEYSLNSREAETLSRLTEGRLGQAVKALREDRLSELTEMHSFLGKRERGYWSMVSGLLDTVERSVKRTEDAVGWELAEKGLRVQRDDLKPDNLEEEVKAFAMGEVRRRREEMLTELLAWYRDILVWKQTSNSELLISGVGDEELEKQVNRMDEAQLERAVQLIGGAVRSLRSNVSFHNVMENLLVQLAAL